MKWMKPLVSFVWLELCSNLRSDWLIPSLSRITGIFPQQSIYLCTLPTVIYLCFEKILFFFASCAVPSDVSLDRDSAKSVAAARFLPDASADRLLTQRWSPPPWIMHEIRVQITPINMQYSLRWLNCHLIVMNMWKNVWDPYSPPLILTFFFFFLSEMSLRRLWKYCRSLINAF